MKREFSNFCVNLPTQENVNICFREKARTTITVIAPG